MGVLRGALEAFARLDERVLWKEGSILDRTMLALGRVDDRLFGGNGHRGAPVLRHVKTLDDMVIGGRSTRTPAGFGAAAYPGLPPRRRRRRY